VPAHKKDGEGQAIGRSKGGLSTKIHALVDALGNPLDFILTPGQAHDLEGADALLPDMAADTLLADKAFDADERVIEPLLARGKSIVIPSKSNRKVQRDFDRDAYKARHLIENFFCKLKQYRAIATRYDKTARTFLAAIHLAGCYHLAQLRTGSSSPDAGDLHEPGFNRVKFVQHQSMSAAAPAILCPAPFQSILVPYIYASKTSPS
jgi:transposase